MKHPIPDSALDDRLGFLGMTGSGKTYGAGTCVERILHKHGRVIIPDPLGVWYGLRLMADGKTASPYDVVIFGGPHADLPITPHAGALIGETVATMRESAIIDLSQFETAASERTFMLAFLESIYRKSQGHPVHLVFDEADLWAPERITDKEGNATKLHGVMQTVVRRGRIKGLTSWLISQRPASLSKNVLSQVDGLAAFRLTASQDRAALNLWIEGQADKEQGKAILDRLPTKEDGEAVVWLPRRNILVDAKFPPKETFDSSRAPKRGETIRKRALPPVDLTALKDKLSSVEAEVKASHVPTLRAEIARLTKENAALRAAPKGPDAGALEVEFDRGKIEGIRHANTISAALYQDVIRQMRAKLTPAIASFHNMAEWADAIISRMPNEIEAAVPIPRARMVSHPIPEAKPSIPRNAPEPASPTVRKIIDVIHRSHPIALSFEAASLRAGVSRRSSAYRLYRQQLESSPEVDRRSDGRFTSAPGYAAPVGPGTDPVEEFANKLPPSYAKMLRTIADSRHALSRDEIADRAGVSPTSSGLAAGLRELAKLSLIEKDGDNYSLHGDIR